MGFQTPLYELSEYLGWTMLLDGQLIETAMGKAVQRDVDEGHSTEDSEQFGPEVEDRDPLPEE